MKLCLFRQTFELYKISNTSILTSIDYMSKPIIMQSFNKDNAVERIKVAFDRKRHYATTI